MIVRTPLPKKRKPESTGNSESPNSDGRLIIFEDLPVPEPSHQHSDDQMLCTYQCRQLVLLSVIIIYFLIQQLFWTFNRPIQYAHSQLVVNSSIEVDSVYVELSTRLHFRAEPHRACVNLKFYK